MKLTRLCIICIALLFSPALLRADVAVENNITYCKAGDVELKLDLAKPDGDGPFPAIVFIHGGGWSGGNRQAYSNQIKVAARRGYVAITVSYRLTQPDESGKAKNPWPAQINDTKCAVRWLRANADKYHVDPNRIGVTGGSAGGHLSLMVGLADESAKLEGDGGYQDQSSRVQAVVNVFGPTEMKSEYRANDFVAKLVKTLLGGTPDEVPDRYENASPVTYISSDDPPVLTLQGTKDPLVPDSQARLLDERMKAKGADHELMIFEGAGHGFQRDDALRAETATWAFFDKHLQPAK